MSCQKCQKSDQPEWILLCDTCNQGWHGSCLRPALMVIPDGDWYCPPCRHVSKFIFNEIFVYYAVYYTGSTVEWIKRYIKKI